MRQTSNMNTKRNVKTEFIIHTNETIEIRYFDNPKDPSCFSWKLPIYVIKELVKQWKALKNNKEIPFPINKRGGNCEFTMHTEKYIDIKEKDSLGRFKMGGFSLPTNVVEVLVGWYRKNHG